MGDSCTSVSLSLVGSIAYLPRTSVENWEPISSPETLLKTRRHDQLEAGKIPRVLIVLQFHARGRFRRDERQWGYVLR